jgi:hypothetical protein
MVWTNAVTSNRTISCGTSDASCNLAGEFIIMDLGTIDITISEGINVDTGGAAAGSGSSGVKKFRIIARGAGLNPDVQRVIVSYYASEV